MDINGTSVRPHIYNGGDIRLEKLPLNDGVTALELNVHNIYSDELDTDDPGYTKLPEAKAGPLYVAYDSNITVSWTLGVSEEDNPTVIDDQHSLMSDAAARKVDVEGAASVTWEEYDNVTIKAARLYLNGVDLAADDDPDNTGVPRTVDFDPLPERALRNGSNALYMQVDLEIDEDGDEVIDFTRTYESPQHVIYYHQTLLALAATDFESNVLWTRQYSNTNWHDKAQFENWANEAYDYRYDDDDGTWHYGTASGNATAYELSSVALYHEGELNKTVGTSACLWSFQMTPHRSEVFAPQAILQMSDYIYVERSPLAPTAQRCFGQSNPDISTYRVMGNVLWSVNSTAPPSGPWYTTCDSLAPFQPTSLTSSAPYFEGEWDEVGIDDAYGSHYGFADYTFTWFYILVEDYWQSGTNTSLIGNYIYVDDNIANAAITTDASSPDSPTGKYDWTEYDYADSGAPRPFVQVRSGSSAGEDDFTDDASGNVVVSVDDTSQQYPWNLPQNAVGDTIAIPLDVEYHWPDVDASPDGDESVATGHKTVYAQKGIVVRVEVAACGQAHTCEIWAGESRPRYNDGASECGPSPRVTAW